VEQRYPGFLVINQLRARDRLRAPAHADEALDEIPAAAAPLPTTL